MGQASPELGIKAKTGLLGGHSLVPYPLCPLFFLLPSAKAALLQVLLAALAPAPPEQQPGLGPGPHSGPGGCWLSWSTVGAGQLPIPPCSISHMDTACRARGRSRDSSGTCPALGCGQRCPFGQGHSGQGHSGHLAASWPASSVFQLLSKPYPIQRDQSFFSPKAAFPAPG